MINVFPICIKTKNCWFQFLEKHNYTYYENHTIITPDKYILTTVRIPRGLNESSSNTTKKHPVILLHGIWSNPQDLILMGPNSIGFLLVESGFDVYLMASRGNTYSTAHEYFSTDSVEYWDFGFDEVGRYDIPCNIDYVKNLTGNSNVSFIGHSQGGTSFVTFAATRPEYLKSITSAHLFAPVVYMDYSRLPFFSVIKNNQMTLEAVVTNLGLNKGVFTYNPIITVLGMIFCNIESPLIEICASLLGIQGPDPDQLNRTKITVMATNDPAGGSFKQLIHYLQVAQSGKFREYNYYNQNQKIYQQEEPPLYNLTAINGTLLHIWYGENDFFTGEKDYKKLISEIPCAIAKKVENELWNHIDFAFAIESYKYVYRHVLDELLSHV
ncbi:hypothetical protein ABEB36_014225 [Hypothenemus hampei]|uniref:Lipase n=1 Tax=Hypothenemus hampei TaxID=57062 RepID=A0ABD1E5U8_HYPHA